MYLKYRPFRCDICGAQYYRKNVLKAHVAKCKIAATLRKQFFGKNAASGESEGSNCKGEIEAMN